MSDEVEDLKNRVAALEDVVVSLAALVTSKELVTRPEAFRMFIRSIRDIDEIEVEREEETRDTEYRAKTPVAKAIEHLKNEYMEYT